jgi:glutathione S-transferase
MMTDTREAHEKEIVLFDLAASPNNMKARIALNFKGLPFKKIPVDPMDRAPIIEASGQPLTPVLLHGDTVVYDSRAILRYLDSNFRDTPPLFSDDKDTMNAIERFEKFARNALSEGVGIVFNEALSGDPDLEACRRASDLLHEGSGEIEERLKDSEWVIDNRMTAADVTAAPIVFLGMLPPEIGKTGPIAQFFVDNFKLGEDRERTRAWAMRVMAYDR